MKNKTTNTSFIKATAQQLGFDYCGIAVAEELTDDARRLEAWLNKNRHGTMQYMEKNFDLRINPKKLVPGAKSVICLLLNYFSDESQPIDSPRISKYAWGNDYHEVIKEKLNHFLYKVKEKIGDINGRGFIDSAPVLERAWAQRSGLGWIGKNGNLINKSSGSFFFIATLIVDLELEPDDAYAKDFCGSCTRCIDACPTEAILPDKVVDGSRCISYFTIELKEMLIPDEMKDKFQNWMFGCDVCQDVCPWNRFSKPTQEAAFRPIPEILNLTTSEWKQMSEAAFKNIFSRSALQRAKHKGIQRNLSFISPE